MNDQSTDASQSPRHWRTRLIHSTAEAPPGFRSLAPTVYRGSTVVFDKLADAYHDWRPGGPSTYGIYGTPTTLKLAARIAEIENARHTFIVPSGMAAITLIYLAYCRTGSHALMPESAYGNSREVAEGLLADLDIEVESYDPMIGGDIAKLIRDNTSLVWTETPGSITMEVQDVPAIVAAAHARNIPVALDNTYAAGVLFDAFAHGVDVSMQALTKYVGGHSDLLLGTVSVNSDAAMQHVGKIYRLLGLAVSPDDCALALRGLANARRPPRAPRTIDAHGRQLAQSAAGNLARPAPRPPRLPRPRHLEARLHRLRQRVLDRLQRRLDARAHHAIRRRPGALQNRLQLGRRHQPRHGLRIARPREPQLRPPPRPPQHRPRRTARPHERPRTSNFEGQIVCSRN